MAPNCASCCAGKAAEAPAATTTLVAAVDLAAALPAAAATQHPNPAFMARAIELSRTCGVVERTGGCFGCVIVDKDGKVLAEGLNRVVANNDPTYHGEMDAIRKACAAIGSPHLKGCVLYTSAEPCPMCMTACYWARVDAVYYAARVGDVKELAGFEDEDFYAQLRKDAADRAIPTKEFMRAEARKVWVEFSQMENPCHY